MHYRLRTYHPTHKRFMQRAPLGYVAGPSLYELVRGTPLKYVDPRGTIPCYPWASDKWSLTECRGWCSFSYGTCFAKVKTSPAALKCQVTQNACNLRCENADAIADSDSSPWCFDPWEDEAPDETYPRDPEKRNPGNSPPEKLPKPPPVPVTPPPSGGTCCAGLLVYNVHMLSCLGLAKLRRRQSRL